MVADAVLEAISVNKVTNTTTINMTRRISNESRLFNFRPNQQDRFDSYTSGTKQITNSKLKKASLESGTVDVTQLLTTQ